MTLLSLQFCRWNFQHEPCPEASCNLMETNVRAEIQMTAHVLQLNSTVRTHSLNPAGDLLQLNGANVRMEIQMPTHVLQLNSAVGIHSIDGSIDLADLDGADILTAFYINCRRTLNFIMYGKANAF